MRSGRAAKNHSICQVGRRCSPSSGRSFDAQAPAVTSTASASRASSLLPELGEHLRPTWQIEWFFAARPERVADAERLPGWCYDLAGAGYYGFGPNDDGYKVSSHELGETADPDRPLEIADDDIRKIETFVERRLPCLEPRVVGHRTCLYTNSRDGNFLFDRAPGRSDCFVAGAGSGHAFKFAPVLGDWARDLIEGRGVPEEFTLAAHLAGSGRVV